MASASTSRRSVKGVGLSNGCAALALKNPPPFVPKCLIATWEAAGPTASSLFGSGAFSVFGLPCSSSTA